jgi:hypothetical protein
MEQLLGELASWWAGVDQTTHMAVFAFGAVLLIFMIFSIVGTYTNPARRPHNEIDFRRFAEASLAGKKPAAGVDDEEPVEPAAPQAGPRPRL